MRIEYSRSALRFLSKLDRKSVERIRDGICGLLEKPQKGILNHWLGMTMEESGSYRRMACDL